jgi:hypothetical protein
VIERMSRVKDEKRALKTNFEDNEEKTLPLEIYEEIEQKVRAVHQLDQTNI